MHVIAQTNEQRPATVVQNYWAAMQAAQWDKSASLLHSQSLARIRKSSDRFVAALSVFGEANLLAYFGVASKDEYAALSDAIVVERLLAKMAQQPGYQEILRATSYKPLGLVNESDDLVHIIYRADVKLLDAQGRRLEVAKFEQHNELIGVRVEVKLPAPDEAQASVISVKKDGDVWRILAAEDIEKTLAEWEKSLTDFQGHMKKFAESMLDQQKAKSKRKTQRHSRR